MKLYLWLRQRVPWPVAAMVTSVWLASLLFLAVFFLDEPAATFRYANL